MASGWCERVQFDWRKTPTWRLAVIASLTGLPRSTVPLAPNAGHRHGAVKYCSTFRGIGESAGARYPVSRSNGC